MADTEHAVYVELKQSCNGMSDLKALALKIHYTWESVVYCFLPMDYYSQM